MGFYKSNLWKLLLDIETEHSKDDSRQKVNMFCPLIFPAILIQLKIWPVPLLDLDRTIERQYCGGKGMLYIPFNTRIFFLIENTA